MKIKPFLLSICFFGALLTHAQSTPSCVPHNGLQGYWPLDNIHQGNDSWSNIPGSVYGVTLATDRFGASNAAYYFNGISDSIVTTYPGVLGTHARAVSFWAKTPGANPAAGMYAVTWGSNSIGERYGCSIDFPSGCTSAGGAYCSAVHPQLGSGTSDNSWHHYVFQFSGISPNNTLGSVEIYQDAKLVAPTIPSSVPGSYSLLENTVLNTVNPGGYDVRFGKVNYFANESLLQGYLDDIGIWDRMLDTCEIKKLYNCQAQCNKEFTGIASLASDINWAIDFFPNPASDYVTVHSTLENQDLTVSIYNVSGQLFLSRSIDTKTDGRIDISMLHEGIYMMEVQGKGRPSLWKKLTVSK